MDDPSTSAALAADPIQNLDAIACELERHENLVTIVSEMLREATEAPQADDHLYSTWMLLMTGQEALGRLRQTFSVTHEAILANRRLRRRADAPA